LGHLQEMPKPKICVSVVLEIVTILRQQILKLI
jgi:hypothetical protein